MLIKMLENSFRINQIDEIDARQLSELPLKTYFWQHYNTRKNHVTFDDIVDSWRLNSIEIYTQIYLTFCTFDYVVALLFRIQCFRQLITKYSVSQMSAVLAAGSS
jgi:hypothetical protein